MRPSPWILRLRSAQARFLLLSIVLFLSSCGRAVETASPPEVEMEANRAAWERRVVFYEIFVRSFYDTDADGIGDFNGVTAKLDYLQELGVGGIWLMPIHPSPSYHGYDVTDYYAVNPEYGTMEDFKRLLDEAHKRDIRIILDLVVNHTSNQHPFFAAARDANSDTRDWYIWRDAAPNWGSWHETDNGYYYGFFCDCMPDLNYANPAVTEEMRNAARFWLADVGVDGFRIDAAKHLFEEEGKTENAAGTHEWFAGFYRDYKSYAPEAYTVGEVYGAGGFIAKTYAGQLDQIFNFELASGFVNSAKGESNTGVNSAYAFTLKDAPDGNYGTFLTNHDQNRVMTVLNGNVDKAKVAAALLLTGPGTSFIYYGEEIGMTGAKPDEMIRTPMQWSADANAGFTTGTPWESPNPDYAVVNVAAQENDSDSLLSWYRALVRLRNEHPALQTGTTLLPSTGTTAVFASVRADTNETLLVLVNLSGQPVSDYVLDVKAISGRNLIPLFGMDAEKLRLSPTPVETLAPYGIYIFQVR